MSALRAEGVAMWDEGMRVACVSDASRVRRQLDVTPRVLPEPLPGSRRCRARAEHDTLRQLVHTEGYYRAGETSAFSPLLYIGCLSKQYEPEVGGSQGSGQDRASVTASPVTLLNKRCHPEHREGSQRQASRAGQSTAEATLLVEILRHAQDDNTLGASMKRRQSLQLDPDAALRPVGNSDLPVQDHRLDIASSLASLELAISATAPLPLANGLHA